GERWGGRLRRLGDAVTLAAGRALKGDVRLRAMALTYLSLFALVPALVVAFSVIQAFTGMERIADLVHEFLLENLAVGARTTIEPYLEKFVGNAHAASAGLVGGALLVWSMVSLFSNVDRAVNDVWGIRRPRALRQQAVIYWVGLTLGPLLLAGSLVLGHTARAWLAGTELGFLAAAGGVVLTCAFFATLYVIVPDTKVRPGPALTAGLVAGGAWEVAKWGYAIASARFFRYHIVYGSVAAIPTFLLWLFVSWTIVLFGARLAFILQNATTLLRGSLAAHPTTREALAGQVMLAVGAAFDRAGEAADREAPDAGELARALRVPAEEVTAVAETLATAGLLRSLAGGGLVPGRPLERITLLDVRQALLGRAPRRPEEEPGPVDRALAEVDAEAARRLEKTTLRALVDEERARPRKAATAAAGAGDEARTAQRA
ncbi:MAG TPA: YhjD/YihY/BrkB family envelope integrity protein, partial [Anaeromyxobacteraceae bacterium]|nr:YhjD/YihY/BrkB family envelope integrity protein [Anaeromyxobacteraceae bacterium]